MPNFPIAPDNAPQGDNNPPGNALVLHNPSSGLASRRVEDLAPPKSAYPSVPLDATLYPERGVYGLGIRHVRPFAQWTFERWFNFNYDFYALYLNDLVNAVAADIALEDRDRYDLFVPEEFIPEGDVQIYGRVVRAGSGQESTSPLQTILIKTTRPGGRDNDPGSKWHPGLVMTVEGLPEGSTVNIDNANSGVWCLIQRYENLRQNDQIELSWDGVLVTHIVSPAEVAGSGPIRVFVSRDIILQGGHFGKLTLRFRVSDVVQNFSGDKYQYSKPYFLDSELDPNLLFAPIFLVDYEEATQIDFDTQSEATFEVLVTMPRQTPAPLPRHQLAVTLFGTLADGSTQVFPLAPVVDKNLGVEFVTVDREIIEQLVGGSFRVSFQWLKNDGRVEQSGSTSVSVVGTPVAMPAVTVAPIEVGLIEPDQDITVQIPFYEPHDPDWLETLVIEHIRPGGGGEDYVEEQLAGAQGGTRYVSKEHLKQFEGVGDIAFYYLVNDGAGHVLDGNALTTRKSRELFAHVGERIGNMPTAHLEGALGNNIDPSHVTTPTLLLTLPLTLPAPHGQTEEGDLIHWNAIGSGLDGSASGVVRINGGTAGKPLVFPVSRAILDNNNNGSLRITYSLERSGPPRLVLRSEVLNLTVGRGVQLERPVIDGATLFPDALNPLAALSGAKVIVRYRPMQATDQIKVDWLSRDGLGSATEYTLGNPSTNEVFVTIPARTIARGIRPGGNQISVQYHFNRGAFPYPSDTVDLHLLPLTGLPTPTIDGIGDSTLLDLSKLNDQARARVSVWPFIDAGQFMWMSWEGTFADGSPYREDTYTANLVTENGAANGISPPAPVDKLQRLMDGSHLTIRFWVSLAESPDKNTAVLFGVREHRVQTLPAVLPHPRFNDQPGATLTIQPLDHVDNASVTVAYGGMNPSHSIQLQWIFPDGGVADIGAKDGLDGGRVDFVITNEVLADSVGKTIELRYVATINGSPVPSEVQVLRVESIAPNNLPRPLINSIANGGSLNMDAIVGNPLASVAKWDLSKQGQKVWLTCTADRVEPLYILDGYSITSAEARNGLASKAVERSWFLYLANGGIFTLTCKVTFDGSDDESSAVVFQQTTYSVVRRVGIIGAIDVARLPLSTIASPDSRRVYTTSQYGISVIDTASNSVIRTILEVTSNNCAISPDGSILYIIGVGREVRAINTTNFNIIRRFSIPSSAFELVLNSSGTQLYTKSPLSIDIYDANSGRHLASIPVSANGVGSTAYAMALSADGSSFYTHGAIRTGVNALFVIDTTTYKITTTIELPGFAYSLAADPHNTSLMYCTTLREILIFNTDSHTLHKTILLPSGSRSTDISVNQQIARAYVVTTSNPGTLLTFDTRTEEIIGSIDIPRRAYDACVLPDGSRLYTADFIDDKVTVIAL